MSSPPFMNFEDHTTKCPHCGKVNPEIRRVPAFSGPRGEVLAVIFSCASCKKIISMQQITTEAPAPPKAA
jgi:predicted RNA-binding Zn-ribbon protein involved in translation (DUF1610 family)